MKKFASAFSIVGLTLCMSGCVCRDVPSVLPPGEDADHYVESRRGVVVSVSAAASEAGRDILRRGGNAVDAAIATALALQSTYPLAGNVAGGGFMLIHPAPGRGKPLVIDYRECAPAAATSRMYARGESQYTQRAVAVPGTIRGLQLAHQRFGSLPWRDLVAPAISLAREGFAIDAAVATSTNETLATSPLPEFAELHRVYGKPGGGPWKPGDRMVQPDLARTLQQLADFGPDAFYSGPIADALLQEMSRGGGIITRDDLAAYHAIARAPISTRYRGTYDVYAPPAPSSGGAVLIEELNMLQTFDLGAWGRWSPQTIHATVEVMRRANVDRARYLADPSFTEVPERLASPAYAAALARSINLDRATPSRSLAEDIVLPPESPSTTHFSVIDRSGMAVANTYTLERRWGSRIVVRGAGFLLNNDMMAFNLYPGETTLAGQVGTAPNIIAPGKRPISSMTPTIVARDGRVVMITGSPGSRAIPHTVLNLLISTLDYGIRPEEALRAGRFSQEWLPDSISWERSDFLPEIVAALRARGHKVVPPASLPFQGDAHTIWVKPDGGRIGIADRRISGKAAGE